MPLAYIRILRRGDRPGIDNSLPGGSGGEIDNELPGSQPGIDNELPQPPPGIWPPPSMGNPIVPIGPDNSLPVQPGTIWPSPGRPPHIDHGLPNAPARPDQGLPTPPSGTLPARPPVRPDQGLPGGGRPDNSLPSQTFWMLCYAPSLGWKFIAVDPSLEVGHPLPPTAQPK